MFTVNEDGRNYKVEFEHGFDVSEKKRDHEIFLVPVRSTSCIIFNADTGEVLVESTVKLNHKDHPNKDSARKYSLTNALDELFPDNKLIRTSFWREYFERIFNDRIKSKKQSETAELVKIK